MSARAEEWEAMRGKSLVADVRNIDHHAQAIHLPHDLFAEIGEAVVMLNLGIIDVA